MKIRKAEIFAFLLVLISFMAAFYFYNIMPERLASHWNIRGEADGYMSKFWGLFLMPFISLGMVILLLILPKIDPLKKNIEEFRKYYDWFVIIILLFFIYIYKLTILWNLNYRFNMGQMLTPAFAGLFFYSGILMEKAKRNWFIGIKTPWTLSSETVWEKTHYLGGKLFKISAILCLVGLAFPDYAFYFVIVPIILSALYVVYYSYAEYSKEHK
ncbi:MAG: SdpI family protein [Deltaproteobacteria bacterium]